MWAPPPPHTLSSEQSESVGKYQLFCQQQCFKHVLIAADSEILRLWWDCDSLHDHQWFSFLVSDEAKKLSILDCALFILLSFGFVRLKNVNLHVSPDTLWRNAASEVSLRKCCVQDNSADAADAAEECSELILRDAAADLSSREHWSSHHLYTSSVINIVLICHVAEIIRVKHKQIHQRHGQ